MKKVMHNTDKQYIRVINLYKNNSFMHNLKSNFDKFFHISKSFLSSELNEHDNLFPYSNKPKLSDCEIIVLSITGESIGIDSENYFWGKLKVDHFIHPGRVELPHPRIFQPLSGVAGIWIQLPQGTSAPGYSNFNPPGCVAKRLHVIKPHKRFY